MVLSARICSSRIRSAAVVHEGGGLQQQDALQCLQLRCSVVAITRVLIDLRGLQQTGFVIVMQRLDRDAGQSREFVDAVAALVTHACDCEA